MVRIPRRVEKDVATRAQVEPRVYLRLVIVRVSRDNAFGLLSCIIPLLVTDGIVNSLQGSLVARHLGSVTRFASDGLMSPEIKV